MLFEDSTVGSLGAVLAPFDPIFRLVTGFGGDVALMVLVLMLFWVCERRLAVWLALLLLVSAVLNAMLKSLIQHPRPPASYQKVPESGYGFPSGHAQASATLYGSFAHHWKSTPFRTGMALLITMVSLSRIYLGVHYPGDVIGGALIGIVLAWCGAILWVHWSPRLTERFIRRGVLLLLPALGLLLLVAALREPSSSLIPGALFGACAGMVLPGGVSLGPAADIRTGLLRSVVGLFILLPLVALMLPLPEVQPLLAVGAGSFSTWVVPRVLLQMERFGWS